MKNLEIFCGTGGVGKTTLAAARAYFWAQEGQRVLLITIDPSQRLKQILGLQENLAGNIEKVSWPEKEFSLGTFHAMLMSPQKTLEKIVVRQFPEEGGQKNLFATNRILSILSRPYGGLHEILGVLEVSLQMNSGQYDKIILDTAPGEHFIDFLENGKRFKAFFEQGYVEFFLSLKNRISRHTKGLDFLLGSIFQGGFKKLMDYLEKITGDRFVSEFVDTVELIYRLKKSFLEAIKFESEFLLDQNRSQWYLVTAVDHDKIKETITLKNKAEGGLLSQGIGVINKCQAKYWKESTQCEMPEDTAKVVNEWSDSFQNREEKISEMMSHHFKKVIAFDEVLDHSPLKQLDELAQQWQYWEKKKDGSYSP